MEIEYYHYIFAILGGAVAGFMNTLAGNGSAITLTILIEMLGLSATVANGTNRIGVLAQGITGSATFYKYGQLDIRKSMPFALPLLIGALVGVYTAINISPENMKNVIAYLMVMLLFILLVNPKRWLIETDDTASRPLWVVVPVFLALGFYGGFIQMGMGLFFIAAMVLGARYSLVEANGIKLLGVTFYTLFVIAVFAWNGQINWQMGGILAIGQAFGGWIAARFATQHPRANIWVHRLLVVVIVTAIIRLFGWHEVIWNSMINLTS